MVLVVGCRELTQINFTEQLPSVLCPKGCRNFAVGLGDGNNCSGRDFDLVSTRKMPVPMGR